MDSRQISAARLIAQGLVGPAPEPSSLSPAARVVEHLGCVQAQALGGALVSIALRLRHDQPEADLDAVRSAIDSGEIVRTWTQRGTIHLTTAKDLGWILGLTGQRTLKAVAKRREFFGITDAIVDSAAQLAEDAIRSRGALSRQELLDAFAPLDAGDEYGHERYLITTLALHGIIVQAPMIEDKDDMRYVLTADWVPNPVHLDAEAGLREWMRRFVNSHGPVTIDDAARWTALPKTGIRKAILSLVDAGDVAGVTIDDREFFQAPDLEDRLAQLESSAQEMLLLPGFDEIILGYKDRSPTLDPAHEKAVVPGGNGMFKNTVIDGTRARGTWKRSPRKTGPRLIVEPFAGQSIDFDLAEAATSTHPAFT